MEEFRDVLGYEGLYQVSNLGNVKTLSKKVCNITGCRITKTRLLKLSVGSKGYFMCALCRDKHRKTKDVHKLVAEAFLNHKPDGTNKIVVDHINANKLDNRLENLQLITNRENCSKDRTGSSKYTGVCWHKTLNKWRASIRINDKKIHLGYFKDEYEAHLAYQNKLKQINYDN